MKWFARTLNRRDMFCLSAVSAAWPASIACRSTRRDIFDSPAPTPDARLHYGPEPYQFGDLRLPAEQGPHAVAIVVHGGFWRAQFGLDYMGHMCAALARAGIASWNLEYRRIGNPGGGWPNTFLDVAQGADHLRELATRYPLDLKQVITIGHSAGGHLALWLAARRRIPSGDSLAAADPIAIHGAAPIAGLVDLRRAWELRMNDGAVADLMGGPPEKFAARYHSGSPVELVPLGVRTRLLHGTEDTVVPIEISNNYQKAADRAGDDARMIVLHSADHFAPVDPRSRHWPDVEKIVQSLVQ